MAIAVSACEGSAPPKAVRPHAPGMVLADDIPIAHTPKGGYGVAFPKPILTACTEPLAKGAPDLRGVWRTLRAQRDGKPAPAGDRIWDYAERIEQCGDRIVDMGGGTIADARATGAARDGVRDVSFRDFKTPITATASYERGVFVLRPGFVGWLPVGLARIQVTRQLDADGHMIWTRPDMGHQTVVLERIGGPNDAYTIHRHPGP